MDIDLLIQILIFLSVAYFLVFKMIKKLIQRSTIENAGIEVKAEIVDNEEKDFDGPTYYPVLKYTTEEGQEILAISENGSSKKWELGKEMQLSYLPSDPAKFIVIDSYPIFAALCICIGVVGLLIIGMGIAAGV